jgi:lycopene beta-cyclase
MSPTTQDQYIQADFLFAGAGASAILLLLSLEKRNLLEAKKIIVVDPDSKLLNDKTYCFWQKNSEIKDLQCGHLISHQWQKINVNRQKSKSINPLVYCRISSLDLYKELDRLIAKYDITRIYSSVNSINISNDGSIIETEEEIYEAKNVFDSRPPKFKTTQKNESFLLQSFIGYVIETEKEILEIDTIDLMDFNVEQLGWTQFVYVLPFDNRKALVELTRFGKDIIGKEEASPILDKYIFERFGKFKIAETEIGCIPMSNAKRDVHPQKGVIVIGGRAGAIKPSTGYALKKMSKQAELIADSLAQNKTYDCTLTSNRFSFYDRLLLLILSLKPNYGKFIFEILFKKNKIQNVLAFLEEKTTIYEDLKILLSLPFKPFLQVLWLDLNFRMKKLVAPIMLLIVSLTFFLSFHFSPTLFSWLNAIILIGGVVLVGIPHGAIDHLLDSGNIDSKIKLTFIFNYLLKIVLYFILWLILPKLALIVFLMYSIWHFGQNDLIEWKLKLNPFKIILWGFCLFTIILLGHLFETNSILKDLKSYQIPLNISQAKNISQTMIALTLLWAFWEKKVAILLLSLTLLIGNYLPLISAFGLYFIGQHSLNGWSHLKQGMNSTSKTLTIKALPFTLGAFLLFFVLLFAGYNGFLENLKGKEIATIFIFISCISFPHVIEMHRFYKDK